MVCNKREVMINFIGVISVWKPVFENRQPDEGTGIAFRHASGTTASLSKWHLFAHLQGVSQWMQTKMNPFRYFRMSGILDNALSEKPRHLIWVYSLNIVVPGDLQNTNAYKISMPPSKNHFSCARRSHTNKGGASATQFPVLEPLKQYALYELFAPQANYRSPLHKAFLLFAVPQCSTREQQGLNVVEARCTASSCKIKLLLS